MPLTQSLRHLLLFKLERIESIDYDQAHDSLTLASGTASRPPRTTTNFVEGNARRNRSSCKMDADSKASRLLELQEIAKSLFIPFIKSVGEESAVKLALAGGR
ncbi:hypothetical protein IP69_06165 [Bosea sp. AAP35]|nr:hypothetical protein IP69_06165 [Bosea sp. AAP35]